MKSWFSVRGTIGAAAVAVLGLATPVHAESVSVGDLVISQPWTRATAGGAKVGGGFLTIENKGEVADKLVGGSTDAAGKLEVHQMSTSNGVMKMHQVEGGLTIEPGKTVKLEPGGYHLMLVDLKHPLRPSGVSARHATPAMIALNVKG